MAHILYIEDNRSSITLVRKVLKSRGHTVMWAYTGQEGLDLAMAHPSVILLDVKLPDMDGYEVARRLRSSGNSHLAYVPIIALTAHTRSGEIEKALDAGCNVFMTKPINFSELSAHVEAYMHAHNTRRRQAQAVTVGSNASVYQARSFDQVGSAVAI